MATCPHCFEEKELFATVCPHCIQETPMDFQVQSSVYMWLIQVVGFATICGMLWILFG